MLYDLNVQYNSDLSALKKTIAFLQDLGYTGIAINYGLSGKLPSNLKCPADIQALQTTFPSMKILSRVTMTLDDASQHQNLGPLYANFDIVAFRPVTERAFQSACTALDVDLISLNVSQRLGFFLRIKTACAAIERGIKFEICYGGSVASGDSRRHVITNAASIFRACRKRGIVVSSEAISPLSCRGPADVINLLTVWGLDHSRANDTIGKNAGSVVKSSYLRKNSYKQTIQTEPRLSKKVKV
jgi:ribonuclease P/MRP protein subunit RPP1